jgi:hypothetical protein
VHDNESGASLRSVSVSDEPGHLQCPFCSGYEVDRLYLASLDVDSCACATCGARWDERHDTGDFIGRGTKASVFTRRT